MVEKINLDDSEIDSLRRQKREVHYGTRYNFLLEHNGLRRNKMHLIIGTSGGGKSTIRNSILIDFIAMNPGKKIFLWLSEETIHDFKSDLAEFPAAAKEIKNVYVYSEQGNQDLNYEEEVENFFDLAMRSNCDLFLFDNITTSNCYPDGDISAQFSFAKKLKMKMQQLNCALFVFAHTASSVKKANIGMIDQNDIRGAKSIVNLAEFLYVMQTFQVGEALVTSARITKHRGHNIENSFFIFHFSREKRIYDFDGGVDFEYYNELYTKQNRLGQSKKN